VLFDLDGTITRPNLNFDALRAEIGIPGRTPILEWLAGESEAERERVWDILDRHELEAARTAELADGVREVLAAMAELHLRSGLVTRNSRRSADVVVARLGLRFDAVVTREDCAPKPSPEPVRECARRLGVPAASTLVVGDFYFDIQSGYAAGARTALVGVSPSPPFPGPDPVPQADYRISTLHDLIPILRTLTGEESPGGR
jgi:HAD superfamily hydrolase (TIGR01549 family)